MTNHKRVFSLSFITVAVLILSAGISRPADARQTDAEIKRRMVQAAKAELNQTVWEVKLRPITNNNKRSRLEIDTLRFDDYKVKSDKLNAAGFGPTNYTLRLKGKDNNIVIWETMQTSEKKGVAFWKGEIENGVMSGVLSWHINDKNKKDYSFVSITKQDIEVAVTGEEEEEDEVKPPASVGVERVEPRVPAAAVEVEKVKPPAPVAAVESPRQDVKPAGPKEPVAPQRSAVPPPSSKPAPKKEKKKKWWLIWQ